MTMTPSDALTIARRRIVPETSVASAAVAYFADLGWNLAFEAQLPGLSGRPDIVGTNGKLTLIVECKSHMGLDVMRQAYAHRGRASYVYIATPPVRPTQLVDDWLKHTGIGWLMVSGFSSAERAGAALNRRACVEWVSHLKPEHRTALAPGSAGGGYWTPFAETCRNVSEFVARHPGCNTSEVVRNVKHHYRRNSTAIACLARWGRSGKIAGVTVDGNSWHMAQGDK